MAMVAVSRIRGSYSLLPDRISEPNEQNTVGTVRTVHGNY